MNHYLQILFNKLIALLGLIILSPIIIIASLLLKIENPELSPFFVQQRIGKDQRAFNIYKLRSMKPIYGLALEEILKRNEAGEVLFKIKDDPRVTRVGKIIRKTSIDELPQLLNVLKGDMALVGPRPPLPLEVDKYSKRELKRLEVLPGCTGLWQVSGRSDVSFSQMIDLDLQYIEKQSLWFDFKILLLTIPTVLRTKGAY